MASTPTHSPAEPGAGDALILVDLQRDFLPGGALGVPDGDAVIPVLNRWISAFEARRLPVFATRDWHPVNHCSFAAQGGPWPPHCIAGSDGARFADELQLPAGAHVISKATGAERDAYSGFQGTALAETLRDLAVRRLFIGGLATDYCVLHTVLDARENGFEVALIVPAIRAVDRQPGDGAAAIQRMQDAGAMPVTSMPE